MPNSPDRRVENYCMPPKKSAWRFENTELPEHLSSKSEFVQSEKINSNNMGQQTDDSGMKPVDQMHFYPSMETFSRIKHQQSEDAPLDFSLKKCDSTDSKTETANHLMNRYNYEQHNGGSNMMNHPVQIFHPASLFNGNHSPSSLPNNSPDSQASSSFKDSDSIDMDCSQESVRSPLHPVTPYPSGTNEINRENSPEHRSISRENSPANGHSSILEGMLKGQQQTNFRMSTTPQTFGNGYAAGMGVYENQVITSPSPPMGMSTPVMHPASMLPLAMNPYFPFGYVDQPNPFMPGYMYKPPEPNMVDVSAVRKTKRKVDPFTDSLKLCSVEELRKKLDSLSRGGSLGINPDYAVNLKPPYSTQRENGTRYSNNVSLETVNNNANCSTVSKGETSETDNAVSNHDQINAKHNGITIHNNENSTITTDVKSNENNSPNADNHIQINGTNGATSISGADDTNDSMPNAMLPTSPNGRRRNPSQDYRDDPNYRMKRAKNNLAARRSRESRRIKEEIIRQTAAVLEQQNKVMARDMQNLRLTYEEVRMKYFAVLKDFESMKIQNSILTERLNQKRCGQCGSALPNVN